MANIKSAKKRIKVNETKRANNVPVKSVMKTTIKKALVNPSEETLKEANKKIDKALNSGIITKNKAARQKSRIAKKLNNNKKIYLAKAYRYNHKYTSDNMEMKQQILEKNTGILIIRELPDTVTANKTEAEAYSAVWDLMIELEKNLPMAFVFYGQDSLVENNKRYDEIGIFLPNSIFLKHLEKHVAKAEAIIYANK